MKASAHKIMTELLGSETMGPAPKKRFVYSSCESCKRQYGMMAFQKLDVNDSQREARYCERCGSAAVFRRTR